MTAAKDKVHKMKHRKSYRNVWHTDLMSTMAADTPYCCFALFCGPCASYKLRKRALYGDMSRYTCCGGYMPCSGKCGERKCPKFYLCTEVFFCFGNSVASTRFMLQDEFNIQTTKCDNCIVGCMVCLQHVACIFSIIACIVGSDELNEASQLLNCVADLVFCSVCTCMQVCQNPIVELYNRDGRIGTFGNRPNTRLKWTNEVENLECGQWMFHLSRKCQGWINHIRRHLYNMDHHPMFKGTRPPILHNIKATRQCILRHNKGTHLPPILHHIKGTHLPPILHRLQATHLQLILLNLLHIMFKAIHQQVNTSNSFWCHYFREQNGKVS